MNNTTTTINTAMVNIRTSARETIKVSVSSIIDSIKDNGYIDRHDDTHCEGSKCLGLCVTKDAKVGMLLNADRFCINELHIKDEAINLSTASIGGVMKKEDVADVLGWKRYNESLTFKSNHVTDVYLLDGTHLHIED